MIQQNGTATLLDEANSGMLIAQATSVGSWQYLSYECPINPIHAILLRTGRILFIAGSGNDPNNVGEPAGSAVWDRNSGFVKRPTTPVDGNGDPLDLFCVGHSFLQDGRLMCVGGTDQYDPFHGLPAAFIFDPIAEEWSMEGNQPDGARWYPTAITLGDGRVLALSGLDENGGVDTYPEIYSPTDGWQYFSGPADGWANPTIQLPMYSHLFLTQDGRLFYSGAYFESTGVSAHIITVPPIGQPFTQTPVGGLQDADYGEQAASVLLPPAQDQKVMMIGGGNGYYGDTTNRVNIIDLKASNPTYTAAAPLNYKRMHHNAVILPDRTVFVCNGSAMGEDMNQGTRTAEIYDPATNKWTIVASAQKTRPYHAVAVLLPDGRVLTTGGNPDRDTQDRSIEIYSPAYMSQPRPQITSAPQTIKHGQSFQIQTSVAASNISRVNLIKPMATTHCLDTEQRLVGVNINSRSGNSLNVTVLPNSSFSSSRQRNIAPPGWYMLTILDNNKVPSVATWVQVQPA